MDLPKNSNSFCLVILDGHFEVVEVSDLLFQVSLLILSATLDLSELKDESLPVLVRFF